MEGWKGSGRVGGRVQKQHICHENDVSKANGRVEGNFLRIFFYILTQPRVWCMSNYVGDTLQKCTLPPFQTHFKRSPSNREAKSYPSMYPSSLPVPFHFFDFIILPFLSIEELYDNENTASRSRFNQ